MKKTKILLLIVLLILFFSCKTPPPPQGIIEPFGVIGDKADIYLYIPVKENRSVIEDAFPLAKGDDMKAALGRTTEIFSGVFFNGVNPEVRICMKGQYPYKLAGSFFKKKNGWNPKKTNKGLKYYESEFVDISIPSALIACVGLGDKNRQKMSVILDKLDTPSKPEFSKKFNSVLTSDSGEIGIFVKNSDYFLSQIIGVHLGLPVGEIEMFLKKSGSPKSNEEQLYKYDLSIQIENANTAMLLQLFLKKMLGVEVNYIDEFLVVKNREIPESKIVKIVKSMYPYQ